MSSIYTINKGVNKPVEFKGVKAQYISYLGIGLVALLLLFTVLYVCGVPIYVCLPIVGIFGYVVVTFTMRFSQKYGQYGLIKEAGYRRLPHSVHCPSRAMFLHLQNEPQTT